MSNEKKSLIDRLLVVLGKQKEDPTLTEEIKKLNVKLEETPAPAPTDAPAKKEVKTIDGKILCFEGEIQTGTPIFEKTAEGETPAVDGTYTLEDGSMITVVGGLVTEAKQAEAAAAAAPAPAPQYLSKEDADSLFESKLSVHVQAQNQRIETLEKSCLELANAAKITAKFMSDVLGASVPDAQEAPKKSWDEMTPYERRQASK